jgi:Flp pilus assembly protein TadD
VNNLLGIAYEGKGLRERALQSFEVAVHSEENNAEHLNNLGFLLFKSGDYERASKYLKKAAKLSPKDARIWNNLALTQCQRGKFDDAFDSFVKAVGEFDGHVNLAAQLQSRGYAKDAIQHLEKAQAIRPNAVAVLTKLVALYEMTGRPTDAENTRRSIVALKTFADANK